MQRDLRLNPTHFIHILLAHGLVSCGSNGTLQGICWPNEPVRRAVVRLNQPLKPDDWHKHLDNLEIPISTFEEWHDAYRPPVGS